jgi:hypothetical protein
MSIFLVKQRNYKMRLQLYLKLLGCDTVMLDKCLMMLLHQGSSSATWTVYP